MIVKPETFKKCIALTEYNDIIDISNKVLRKCTDTNKQNKNLSKNSICIVCNFRFLENKILWSKKVKAICHPFNNDSIFPSSIKKYLFSESDFCDKLTTITEKRMKKWDKKRYDFVYFTLISREGTKSKGLYLLPLINKIAADLGLKGLVINYATRETAKHKGTIYHKSLNKVKEEISSFKNLEIVNAKFHSEEVCAIMKSCKFVLLPSDADASPRLLVETLVRNRPLVVNSAIYGGWKYINDSNGAFFDAPTIEESYSKKYNKDYEYYKSSLKNAILKTLSIENRSEISKNFYTNYGFLNASKKMAKIINEISGTRYKAVAFKEWKKSLRKVVKNEGRV